MVQVSAAVWFGADGFEVTGVREERGEVVVWVQTPVQGAPGGVFARRPGGGGAPGEGAVEKAGVGVPRPGVRGGVLDRADGAAAARAPCAHFAGCGQAGGG